MPCFFPYLGGCLTQATGLTLGLEQGEDIAIAHWPLDVTDDGPSAVVEELDTDLGDVTTGAGAAKDLHDTGVARLLLQGRVGGRVRSRG